MKGLLTHVATAECFITLPHPTLKCGIVTAWWRSQVEGEGADTPMRRQRPTTGKQAAREPLGGTLAGS